MEVYLHAYTTKNHIYQSKTLTDLSLYAINFVAYLRL
jgi:hypothetical protein